MSGLCTVLLVLAAGLAVGAEEALLFLDRHTRLSSASGLDLRVGVPRLLSEYRDPSSFVGWGYPSVWPEPDGWRMVYQGWLLANGSVTEKLALQARSPDGVQWSPSNLAGPCLPAVPNCLFVAHNAELSFVYDDAASQPPAGQRLKMLFSNGSVSVSADGDAWQQAPYNWTSTSIDPGMSVFRDPNDRSSLVATARPQALRKAQGRHAGFHSAGSWDQLGKSTNHPALPLDRLYSPTDQIYGLPSFGYHGQVISYFWRYSCPKFPCYLGGTVDSALAYSYNSRNWSAFGQDSGAVPVLFSNQPDSPAAGQVYPNTLIEQADRLLIHASASTHQHGHVSPTPGAWSSLLTFELRRDGFSYATAESEAVAGTLRTKLFAWEGSSELLINANCTQSEQSGVRIGVLDSEGSELRGYGVNDSVPFSGDSTSSTVRWQGGKLMASLQGKTLGLEVHISSNCWVYALRGPFSSWQL